MELEASLETIACSSVSGDKYPFSPQFVGPDSFPPLKTLSAPPAQYSKEYNREINQIIARQKKLTDEEKLAITKEDHISPAMILEPVMGSAYTPENYPALYTLLRHAASDAWRIGDTQQEYWKRTRPWLADQRVEVGRALGGLVEVKMQRRHGVDRQALEQAVAQPSSGFVECCLAGPRVAPQQREVDLRMRIVGRDLDGIERDHADPRVLQLADQLGQIALDLVGDAETAVGDRAFVFGHRGLPRSQKAPPGEDGAFGTVAKFPS